MQQEQEIEETVRNYPNLIHPELQPMLPGKLGEVNVCLQQVTLPGDAGRLDLAFVTKSTVHLVELKDVQITESTVDQLRRYHAQVAACYPNHKIVGYVVGELPDDRARIESYIGDDPINILVLGIDLPRPGSVYRCPNRDCGKGYDARLEECPYCGHKA